MTDKVKKYSWFSVDFFGKRKVDIGKLLKWTLKERGRIK